VLIEQRDHLVHNLDARPPLLLRLAHHVRVAPFVRLDYGVSAGFKVR
jgi:hypothetical protein